jgi:hypothetical protein
VKKQILLLIVLILIAQTAFAQGGASGITVETSSQPQAIIIAIEFYSAGWAWRPDAIKDANKIAWVLTNHGFNVQRLYSSQATSKNILKAIDRATSLAGGDGQVLFYFTGHGLRPDTDPQNDYVVPYGANREMPEQFLAVSKIKGDVTDTIAAENALFIFDTGSTLTETNKDFGTIQELATALSEALTGSADTNNNGRVEFVELARQVEPKVKKVKIHARPVEEIFISETEVVVKSTKIRKKKRRKQEYDRFRPDPFDKMLEMRIDEKMLKLEQKLEDIDQMMQDPGKRLPRPR